MPTIRMKGAAMRIHPRFSRKGTSYAKSLPGMLQKKLEQLPPPTPVRTLADMTPEEQAAIRALYETRENKR